MDKFRKVTVGGLLALIISSVWSVTTGSAAEESVFGKLAFTYETPHISWARSYGGKKLGILVIAPAESQRESVELWQRLECEIIPLMTAGFSKFTVPSEETYGPGYMEVEDVLALTRKALSTDWNVAVVGRCSWDSLPSDVRIRLLLGVKERGAGLVVIDQEDNGRQISKEMSELLSKNPVPVQNAERTFSYAFPWEDFPVFRSPSFSKPFLSMATFGKGRIIDLEYRQTGEITCWQTTQCLTPTHQIYPNREGLLPYPPYSQAYDYYLSLVIKCILWAGNAEGNVRFHWFSLPQVAIERDALILFNPWPTGAPQQHWWIREKAKIRFGVEGNATPSTTVEWIIRNPYNEVEAAGKTDRIQPEFLLGEKIELPVLPAGKHYFEAWLKDNGRVLDWGIISFMVKAECRPPLIKLDKLSFDRNEEIRGKVFLNGEMPSGANLSIEIWDNLKRLLVKKAFTEKDLSYPFSLLIPDPITQSYIIKAMILDTLGVVAETRQEFLVPARGNSDYQFHVWALVRDEPVTNTRLKRLKDLGVDGVFCHALWAVPDFFNQQAWALSRQNLRILPYMSSYCGWGLSPGEKDAEGNPLCPEKKCLFDPDFGKGLFSSLKAKAGLLAPFAPLSYCLSEEDGLDFNQTDRCFDPPSLEDFRRFLKKSYGTIDRLNESWGSNYKDFSECTPITFKNATTTKEFVRWTDHRLHMTEGWVNFHLKMVSVTLEQDPRTIPLFYGSNLEPYHSLDPWPLQQKAGSVPGTPWLSGGASDIEEVVSFSPPGACLSPVYGIYPPSYNEDNMRLQPWLALAGGCNGNEWFATEEGSVSQGNMMAFTPSLEETETRFGQTLEEVRDIKKGPGALLLTSKRRDDGIRVFYSYSSMLVSSFSRAETTWIDSRSDLVAVLHDAGLGYRMISYEDVSGGKLRYPEIKILFLPYSQAISAEESASILRFVQSGGTVIADLSPGVMDEHGKVLGKSSLEVLFPKKEELHKVVFGRGAGIYLGKLLRGYSNIRSSDKGAEIAAAVCGILEEAGVKPAYSLDRLDESSVSDVQGSVFDDGEALYVLLLRTTRGEPPAEMKIKFDRTGEVYDVREGKHLGKGETVLSIACSRAKLLSLLPYKVNKINVTAKSSERQMQLRTEVDVGTAKAGRHVFHLAVIGPDNKEISYLARNITVSQGRYEGTLNLALNDPAGKYILKIRDVASGVTGEAEVLIK